MRTLVRRTFTVHGIAVLLAASLLLLACQRRPAAAPPPPPLPVTAVALLADNGKTGRVVVVNAGGTVELSQPNTVTTIAARDLPPSPPVQADDAEIARRFGAALDGLPAPQREFVLNFELGGERLTPESEALIPQLLQAVDESRSTDVSITGHTDTTGTPASNFALGLRRAEYVAGLLTARGLQRESVSVESHGEGNLLVKTADNTDEPRNRRVEVIVR